MINISVIPATFEDETNFVKMHNEYIEELEKYSPECTLKTASRNVFEEFVSLQHGTIYFINLMGRDKKLGYCVVDEYPYTPMDTSFHIRELYVLPAYRKQGVGSETMKKIFSDFIGYCDLFTSCNNKDSVSFWENLFEKLNINFLKFEWNDKTRFYTFNIR